MNKLLTILIGILLIPTIAIASTGSWIPNDVQPEGYRIYRALPDQQRELMVTVEGTASTATWEDVLEEECQTYYVTAFLGVEESGPSNTADWCREVQIPNVTIRPSRPVTFTITIDQ